MRLYRQSVTPPSSSHQVILIIQTMLYNIEICILLLSSPLFEHLFIDLQFARSISDKFKHSISFSIALTILAAVQFSDVNQEFDQTLTHAA